MVHGLFIGVMRPNYVHLNSMYIKFDTIKHLILSIPLKSGLSTEIAKHT